MLISISVAAVVFINILIAALVLIRNPKSRINFLFFLVALSLSIWSVGNYLTNLETDYFYQLLANRFAFVAAAGVIYALYAFSNEFRRKKDSRLVATLSFILFLVSSALFLTPFAITSVEYDSSRQVTDINIGSGYWVAIAGIIVNFFLVVRNFVKKFFNGDRAEKNQVSLIAWGMAVAFAWVLVTSAAIPAITGDWTLSKFGPIGTIVLSAAIGFTIVKHKLFDIRAIVARSLAYALVLVSLTAVYGLIIFSLLELLFADVNLSVSEQTFLILGALVMAFTFQPLRRRFDAITNRLFYRDAYSSEEVLNQIGQLLASSIDLENISKSTIKIIKDNLKVESATFLVLNKSEFDLLHEIGDLKREINLGTLAKVKQSIFFSDESSHTSLGGQLRDDGIYAFIRLRTKKNLVGYLLLGQKSSGNIFNSQDARFLELAGNELAIGLENAIQFEEIRQFNITLQEKIKAATAELRDKNKKLHELDKAKDDFISMASHQLRTPLTTVKGYLSMVMEGDMGKINKEQKRVLSLSYASAQNMVFLITDLLNVSRLNTGKFVIEPNEYDLVESIQLIMDQLARNAEMKELDLSFKHSMKSLPVYLDEGKLRQVIMNFTDNAIYYTPTGGKIVVSLDKVGDSIEFKVKDNGIGVPKAEQHKLFQKFYRAENAKQTRPDGTGLGIFMAKKVVAAQGGAIIFHSEEGKGSTFGFTFPLKAIEPPAKKSK